VFEPLPAELALGFAPGPTIEIRSRFVPFHCRGTSVPFTRFENAMYSMSSNVTDFA